MRLPGCSFSGEGQRAETLGRDRDRGVCGGRGMRLEVGWGGVDMGTASGLPDAAPCLWRARDAVEARA